MECLRNSKEDRRIKGIIDEIREREMCKSARGEQEKEYSIIFAAFDVFQGNLKDIFSQSFPWVGMFLINFYNGFKAGLFL